MHALVSMPSHLGLTVDFPLCDTDFYARSLHISCCQRYLRQRYHTPCNKTAGLVNYAFNHTSQEGAFRAEKDAE